MSCSKIVYCNPFDNFSGQVIGCGVYKLFCLVFQKFIQTANALQRSWVAHEKSL